MIRRLFNNAFYSLVGRACSTGANLLVIFYVSRFLPAAELGTYGMAFFFMQLFSVLGSLGGGLYFSREIAASREDDRLQAGAWVILRGSSMAGALFSLLLLPLGLAFFPRLSAGLFLLSLFSGFLWGLEMNLHGFLLGLERVRSEALVQVLQLLILAAVLFSGLPGLSLEKLFWLRAGVFLLGLAGRVLLLPGQGRGFFKPAPARPGNWRIFSYFSLNMILEFIARMADIPLLSAFISLESLGAYFLVIRIYLALSLLFEVAAHSLTPFVARLHAGREEIGMNRFQRIALVYSLAGGLLFTLLTLLAAPLVIALFRPEAAAEAVAMLRLLALVLPFRALSYLLGTVLSATGFQKLRFQLNLAWTLGYFLLTVAAVILAGTGGALATRMTADISLTLLLILALRRNLLLPKPL